MNPEPFEPIYERFKLRYRTLSWDQQNKMNEMILHGTTRFINSLSEKDLIWLIGQKGEDQLIQTILPSVGEFQSRDTSDDLGDIPQELAVLGLSVMLVHWICSGSSSARWRTPFSNVIPSIIAKRINAFAEAEVQQAFYDKLGTPVTSSTKDTPRLRNPTAAMSDRTDLAPEVKVNVLRNEMEAMNQTVITTPDGINRRGCLKYHSRSLEAARRFFSVNPAVSVDHLTDIMSASLEILPEPLPRRKDEDNHRHLRQCHNLSYLLQLLRPVLKECRFDVPVDRFLTKQELFGKTFDPEGPSGIDDPHRPPLFTG